jgi:hypothetical protein
MKKYGLILIYTERTECRFAASPTTRRGLLQELIKVLLGMLVGGLERSDIARANAGKADLRAEPADSGAHGSYSGGPPGRCGGTDITEVTSVRYGVYPIVSTPRKQQNDLGKSCRIIGEAGFKG